MEALHDMFPDMKASVLQSVLADCGGNVERAIDCLLNMESIYENDNKKGYSSTNNGPSVREVEFNKPTNPTTSPTTSPTTGPTSGNSPDTSNQLTQLELDELLARELASSYVSDVYPDSSYNSLTPTESHQESIHAVALANVDATVMQEIIGSVKSHLIPILLLQLKSVEIPSICEAIDAGKLGMINVSLDQIRVSEANVPEENVNISVEGVNVDIVVKEVSAKLQQFKWGYEKNTFPKVKDSGNADASISNGTIDVKLKIGTDEFGNPSLAVTECKVNIGQLDIKITGSLASFVYNTLLGIFKKTIKSTLETSLSEMVTSSVNSDGSFNLF